MGAVDCVSVAVTETGEPQPDRQTPNRPKTTSETLEKLIFMASFSKRGWKIHPSKECKNQPAMLQHIIAERPRLLNP
jgi:hypothetical protein